MILKYFIIILILTLNTNYSFSMIQQLASFSMFQQLVRDYQGLRYVVDYPIHNAVNFGYISWLKPHIELGRRDINELDNYKLTPLNIAIMTNNLSMVKYLISKGAQVNPQINPQYNSAVLPFKCAYYWHKNDIMKCLVDHGAIVPDNLLPAIITPEGAISRKLYDDYKALEQEVQSNPTQQTVNKAVKLGHINALKELIKQGFTINRVHLKIAVNQNHVNTVKLLLENGVIPRQAHLNIAKLRKHTEIGRVLKTYLGIKGPNLGVSKHGISTVNNNTVSLPEDIINHIASFACN
jgi:ankyrin repeat protein